MLEPLRLSIYINFLPRKVSFESMWVDVGMCVMDRRGTMVVSDGRLIAHFVHRVPFSFASRFLLLSVFLYPVSCRTRTRRANIFLLTRFLPFSTGSALVLASIPREWLQRSDSFNKLEEQIISMDAKHVLNINIDYSRVVASPSTNLGPSIYFIYLSLLKVSISNLKSIYIHPEKSFIWI